jgi:hypothetical protein
MPPSTLLNNLFWSATAMPGKARQRSVLLTVGSLLLVSCSVTTQHMADTPRDSLPRFTGVIMPITVPVKARYSQISLTANADSDTQIVVTDTGGKKTTERTKTTTYSKMVVTANGDKLQWSSTAHKMAVNGQVYESSIPIVEIRAVSDRVGKFDEVEIHFPALVKEGAKDIPTPGSPEYERHLRALRRVWPGLSVEPVTTGSSLVSIPLSDMMELSDEVVSGIDPGDQVKLKVKGWSYYNDRKVLVTEVDFSKSNLMGRGGVGVSIGMDGYLLFDALTFAIVRSDMLCSGELFRSGERIGFFKGWIKYSASLPH